MSALSYHSIFDRAVKAGKLQDVTRLNYVTRLATIERNTGRSVDFMLKHPSETCQQLSGEPQTVRSYLTAFLALFRHEPRLLSRHPAEHATFKECFLKVDKIVQDKYNANQPNKRQVDAYIPWETILQKRDALPRDSQDYLVLCLYTMIPPLRADFGNVRILHAEPAKSSAESRVGNYVVVRDSYVRLVLNEFKSKSAHMPQYNKILPPDLQKVIQESLQRNKREYLLVSSKGKAFTRDNTYVVYVHRLLEKCLGKKVSISMLRHIYISSLDHNKLTSGQKEQISADMLHSVRTQDRYRLLFKQ